MNPYNGFSSNERNAALRWLNAEYAAGRRRRPTACEVCGQDHGVVDAHSEDYSRPYGPHIGAHSLCFRCHMMVHCRFKNPRAWELYKLQLRNGVTFAALMTRNFPRFSVDHLQRFGHGVAQVRGEPRGATFLDSLL